MRVLQVIPGMLQASGIYPFARGLFHELSNRGIELEVHVNEGIRPPDATYSFFVHSSWKWPPRLDYSPRMLRALRERTKIAHLCHSHGLWNMSNIYPGWATSRNGCKLLFSPHGTLGRFPLAKSRLKKRFIWLLWQKKTVNMSACVHATSFQEFQQIRKMGILTPVAVIPLGVDVPPSLPALHINRDNSKRKLLFLGRITPIKGIDLLLKAWSAVEDAFQSWELQITGIDDRGHLKNMKSLACDLNLRRVRFTEPAYDEEKSRVYYSAELFVLPTYSENFGFVVAEALAHGLPVITTKGTPWQGLNHNACGWWIDVGVAPLVECLKSALSEPSQKLGERGNRGRHWIEADFAWKPVADKMSQTYEWIVNGGLRPQWIDG